MLQRQYAGVQNASYAHLLCHIPPRIKSGDQAAAPEAVTGERCEQLAGPALMSQEDNMSDLVSRLSLKRKNPPAALDISLASRKKVRYDIVVHDDGDYVDIIADATDTEVSAICALLRAPY